MAKLRVILQVFGNLDQSTAPLSLTAYGTHTVILFSAIELIEEKFDIIKNDIP